MTDTAPPASPPQDNGFSMQRPTVVAILYLLNFALGFSVIVGVILAYIWRGEERTTDWERTHYTYLIRTFWIGLFFFVGLFFTWFISIFSVSVLTEQMGGNRPPAGMFLVMLGAMAIFFLSAAWYAVRCILSLVKAAERRPMPNPQSWLF